MYTLQHTEESTSTVTLTLAPTCITPATVILWCSVNTFQHVFTGCTQILKRFQITVFWDMTPVVI